MVVDFALYLRALDWTAAQIGSLMMVSLVVGVGLTMLVGPLSDRIGRKHLLIGYEIAYALAALAAALGSTGGFLAAATVLTGLGRGTNGTAGPFAPAEQAWLAQSLRSEDRGRIYSLSSAVGFAGMAAGALLSALPVWLMPGSSGPAVYQSLFLLVMAGSLVCLCLLLAAREDSVPAASAAVAAAPTPELTGQENRRLTWLSLANGLQGAGYGMTGPLIAYWFALRFGHGPETIGPVMSAALLLAAVSSLFFGRLTRHHGIVPVVVVTSTIGLILTMALPLVPSFTAAAAIYLVRSAFNRGTNGARQALSISIVRPSRRGLAASLSAVSVQVPRSIGPALAGLMYDAGHLAMPFVAGAVFQAGYILIYQRGFRRLERDTATATGVREIAVGPAVSLSSATQA